MQTLNDQSTGRRQQALLIANDERVLSALETFAKSEGFDTRSTWSGREALALIQSHPFDVIMVDNHLPDIYSGEFVRLASRHSRAIVVLQAGPPLARSVRRYKMMGAAAVIDRSDPGQLKQLFVSSHIKLAPA